MIAPAYGELSMQIDDSCGAVSMGSKATPYIANTASSIAKTVANVLPFGSCGDLATSSRYTKAAKENACKKSKY